MEVLGDSHAALTLPSPGQGTPCMEALLCSLVMHAWGICEGRFSWDCFFPVEQHQLMQALHHTWRWSWHPMT